MESSTTYSYSQGITNGPYFGGKLEPIPVLSIEKAEMIKTVVRGGKKALRMVGTPK